MSQYGCPPVDEQFVSDAWNTLDHPISAEEIAELWIDQQAPDGLTPAQYAAMEKDIAEQVRYYLP